MRKSLLLAIAAGGILLIALAPMVASGDGHRTFKANLNGYLEVPSISTPATGRFTARLDRDGDTLQYRLRLNDFLETPLFAHIHFARPDVNGGIIAQASPSRTSLFPGTKESKPTAATAQQDEGSGRAAAIRSARCPSPAARR